MALELTGERTVPGVPEENYWFQRHVAAYKFAAERSKGLRAVDAGCGEGYGTALLARAGASAIGVELVADVVAHARATYPQVEFVQADLCHLPLPDHSADVVVSLQVIEHLPNIGGYLDEIARILVPGGTFICATPNRLTFTPDSDQPLNIFHVKEFTAEELDQTLRRRFDVRAMLGVHHGRRIKAVEREQAAFFPDLVLHAPAQWPDWLRTLVVDVTADDFQITADHIDASLDLLAVATTFA